MVQPEWLVWIEAHDGVEVGRLVDGLKHLSARRLGEELQVEVVVRAATDTMALEYVLAQAERIRVRPKAIEAREVHFD